MRARILIRKGLRAGEEIPLSPGGVVFGRGEEAQVRLPDSSTSRRHCLISAEESSWTVTDLASKNGTCVNGVPVESASLKPGDLIQIGLTTLQILPDDDGCGQGTSVEGTDGDMRGETISVAPLSDGQGRGSGFRTGMPRDSMRALLDIEDLALRCETAGEFFNRALQRLVSAVGGARASAMLKGRGEPVLFHASAPGCPEGRANPDPAAAEKAMSSGTGLLLRNIAIDPGSAEAETAAGLFYSAVYAPIPSACGSDGLIYMDTQGGRGDLDRGDLMTARAAASAAALFLARTSGMARAGSRDEGVRAGAGFGMVGTGPEMKAVFALIARASSAPSPVLIRGESGTGKELVARALHDAGPRKEGPFIALNCAAIPEGLIESELFGHEKGAFTGASGRRRGCFELASGGTLFLDEICEMPRDSQPKLLRAVEERRIRRLGGAGEIAVDVRLVAATNRDVEEEVKAGRFREDLYFRIGVISIGLPPLRSRKDDIPVLANLFLEMYRRETGRKISGFTPGAVEALREYGWPGNVRELRNAVERAVVLAEGPEIGVEGLAFPGTAARTPAHPVATLREMERAHILAALSSENWNKSRAAKALGIERSTLYEKLKALGISGAGKGEPE